jgi:hypothetical protein
MAKLAIVGCPLLRTALAGAAAFVLSGAPFAVAQVTAKVGVTSATDGDPLGKPPAAAERVLRIGVDVQANELITTNTNDRAHLVFLDGSSLTVGPNAQLTIDRFVYDPSTKTGDLAINAGRGVFRLVGGKISKTHAITITTPSSTVGIRGGITILDVKANQTTSTFVFGTSMTVSATGFAQNVTRPGSQVLTNAGSRPSQPTLVPPGALNAQLSQLEGRSSGQSSGGGNADQAAQNSGFSTTNSGQGVTVVGLRPRDNFGSGPGPRNWNPNETAITALTNANNTAPSQQPQPSSQPTSNQKEPSFVFDNPFDIPGAALTTVNELSTLASQRATATYGGVMVGAVNNNGSQFIANGTYQNVWNFGTRSGIAKATFDGASFGGANSPNTFGIQNSPVFNTSQPLPSNSGPARNLDLTGVFVTTPGSPASHQVGAFSVTGQNYQATGAFAGKK